MRLFLNDKEARLIKLTLSYDRAMMDDKNQVMVDKIIERIELCEQLQSNERKSKEVE
ncbi:MAG: hypothetical protein J6J12_00230 [Oscillospiraceae bacterium]|nr:hypothetical protein [Oscillospiraceae bacterium]